jgi:two-component system sensor histidine kinase/response regulator
MEKQTILCVDDEMDNVQALERIFRGKYLVLKATSGMQALKTLDEYPGEVAVIITDQRMPEMTGVEFLERVIDKRPDTYRILLTGYSDMESIVQAVNSGQISRYMTKPWDPVDLQSTVHQFVEKYVFKKDLDQKNKELAVAYSELKTLDSAKNQFMALINHELKTPLTAIISFTDLLKETKLNEDQQLCVDRISRSGERLKNLVDDVLIVIGSESKTLKPKISSFEIKSFDLNLPKNLESQQKKKGQDLVVQKLEDCKLVADSQLIRQVFLKLIHNAIKFGEENSQILVEMKESAPHRTKIAIVNQGPQVSEQIISKILKPFFIDEDVMNHSAGMGLGLTVCQSILKAHNSQLSIENTANGVSVSFELPSL